MLRRQRARAALGGITLLLLGLWALPGQAQGTVQVTNLNDSGPGSLRDALASAPAGATITFAPGLNGTMFPSVPLVISRSLTVQGPGAATIVLDGQGNRRVLDVGNSGAACSITVALSGLTIAHGGGGGSTAGGAFSTARRLPSTR